MQAWHFWRRGRLGIQSLLLLFALLLSGCRQPPGIPNAAPATPASQQPTLGATPGASVAPSATTAPASATPNPSPTMPDSPPEMLNVATPTPSPAGTFLRTPSLAIGTNVHLYYTDRERALTLVNNAGFGWIRQQIHWKDTEGPKGNFGWDELDRIVEAAQAHNIKLLISVVRSPSWARADGSDGMPDNPRDLGDFVEALASRYKGRVQGYEIWNEQNLAEENGGRVTPEDAGRYVELLIEGYKRIKAVDPNAFVLAGAPSSTGVNNSERAVDDLTYLRAMYSYRDGIIKDYFDAQAAHPGGAANPPATLWPDAPSDAPGWNDHPSHYFRHVENLRQVMEEYGLADRQVWITEFGWATANSSPNFEFGNHVSYEQQGQYILDALHQIRNNYPWVGAAFVWNLNFSILWGEQGNPQHEQASFSILNPDWSPRPAFTKIQGFIHAVRQEEQTN